MEIYRPNQTILVWAMELLARIFFGIINCGVRLIARATANMPTYSVALEFSNSAVAKTTPTSCSAGIICGYIACEYHVRDHFIESQINLLY